MNQLSDIIDGPLLIRDLKTGDSRSFSPPAARLALKPFSVEASWAARLCGVSRATWYSLRKAGRIPKPVRLGRRVLWRVEELREWMAAGCPPLSRWEVMKKGRWG